MEIIGEALAATEPFVVTPALFRDLNEVAMAGLFSEPGACRTGPIIITNAEHRPPPAEEIPALMDQLCGYLRDNWGDASAIHLAAYVMWRLNWVHPFTDGNGRTSRVAAYVVLSVKLGHVLPGAVTVPAMIAEARRPYYEALADCDIAWRGGRIDLAPMERLLARCLERQLRSALPPSGGEPSE